MWEPLLFGTTSKKQLILDVVKKKEKTLIKARDKKVSVSVSSLCSINTTKQPSSNRVFV